MKQKQTVSSGNLANLTHNASYICCAVPSKNRPQPIHSKIIYQNLG